MHPYRTSPAPTAPAPSTALEDHVLAALLIALGVARVAIAFARGEVWTADVTVPALLGAVGILLTSRSAARARRRGSAAG